MGPPLTESPGRCRVDERGSCGEPHGGHHPARCASCARAQGLAGTVRGIRCRHGVLLRRCASGAPSRHRGDAAGKDRAGHCCGGWLGTLAASILLEVEAGRATRSGRELRL